MFNRRQAIYGGFAAALLPKKMLLASPNLVVMVKQEYARNLPIFKTGREILIKVSSDRDKASAVAAVCALSGTVEHYWYDLGRRTNEAAILEIDPEFRIGLIYSFMANLNSEPPTPRAFHPLMRLFDYAAACRPL